MSNWKPTIVMAIVGFVLYGLLSVKVTYTVHLYRFSV